MDGNCEYPAVECPIMGRIIENEVCFDICLVAEGTSPRSELPLGFDLTPEKQQQCMRCKNHMD